MEYDRVCISFGTKRIPLSSKTEWKLLFAMGAWAPWRLPLTYPYVLLLKGFLIPYFKFVQISSVANVFFNSLIFIIFNFIEIFQILYILYYYFGIYTQYIPILYILLFGYFAVYVLNIFPISPILPGRYWRVGIIWTR